MSLVNVTRVERESSAGMHRALLRKDGTTELFVTATPRVGEGLRGLLERVGTCVRASGVQPLSLTVLAPAGACRAALGEVGRVFGEVRWPVTWLTPEDDRPGQGMGVELRGLAGTSVKPIYLHGRVVGSMWEDAGGHHCELGDLRTGDGTPAPAEQARQVFEDMLAALQQAGMTFRNVYRTWFRNQDILGWYGDFNRVRTEFFHRQNVFAGLVPASTGIGAGSPFGVALTAGLLALEPKGGAPAVRVVESPLQDSPRKYGSSFSRAVEVCGGEMRRVLISGTASIDWNGATVHVGNLERQVELTMDVVSALLRARGMGWGDVTRAIAYFRRGTDVGAYRRWEEAQGIPPLPVIVSTHTVCRDDLLYEIEVDAMG